MYQVIIVVHVFLGLGIVGLVLMQQGKGADAGAAFGSGASGSVFGAQGSASFLSRTTAIFATLFFTTSLTLAALSGKQVKHVDIMDTVEVPAHSVDVPAASKTPVPAVSAVTDKPAELPAVITAPVANIEAPVVPVVIDNTAKVDENKKAVEQKPTEKKQDSNKSGKAGAKNDKKSSDKSEKKADKAKKHKSDKKDQTSDKK